MTDSHTRTGYVLLDPTAAEALAAILSSTPPLRRFQEGMPNTYVISDACEVEASLSEDSRDGVWNVHSVTTY